MRLFSRKGHVFQSDARTRSHSQSFAKRTLLVHLDAGKAFRAEPEPIFLRSIAVKAIAPTFVIPAAGADVCFADHRAIKNFESQYQRTLCKLARSIILRA
jgi:hypothetical protein